MLSLVATEGFARSESGAPNASGDPAAPADEPRVELVLLDERGRPTAALLGLAALELALDCLIGYAVYTLFKNVRG